MLLHQVVARQIGAGTFCATTPSSCQMECPLSWCLQTLFFKRQPKISVSIALQVVCAPFLYIRAVCVELRLVLSLGASYAATKFSLNYPVELSLRVEHTAVVSSAMSAHVSSWFHKGGIYSAGGLLQAKLPLLLTFREDARPEWCAKSNIETRLIRLSDVPFAEWNCSVPCKGKFAKAEHSFEELSIRSPLWQNWHFLDSCEDDV